MYLVENNIINDRIIYIGGRKKESIIAVLSLKNRNITLLSKGKIKWEGVNIVVLKKSIKKNMNKPIYSKNRSSISKDSSY